MLASFRAFEILWPQDSASRQTGQQFTFWATRHRCVPEHHDRHGNTVGERRYWRSGGKRRAERSRNSGRWSRITGPHRLKCSRDESRPGKPRREPEWRSQTGVNKERWWKLQIPPNILQNRMQIFSRVEEAERPSVDKQRKMAESRTDNRNKERPKTRQRDQRENRKPMEKGRRTAVERRSSRCRTSCWPTSCAGLRSTSSSTSVSPVRSQFPQTSTRPRSGWRTSTPGWTRSCMRSVRLISARLWSTSWNAASASRRTDIYERRYLTSLMQIFS